MSSLTTPLRAFIMPWWIHVILTFITLSITFIFPWITSDLISDRGLLCIIGGSILAVLCYVINLLETLVRKQEGIKPMSIQGWQEAQKELGARLRAKGESF